MGFLSRLFKGDTQEHAQNQNKTSGSSPWPEHLKGTDRDPDEEPCWYAERILRNRLERIFSEEWSGYEVRRDIPAAQLGAPAKSHDYSYGLYLQGQPKAMIMVLEDKDDYRRKSVVSSHRACESKGIFCMNLLPPLPNRRSDISKRLKENVG